MTWLRFLAGLIITIVLHSSLIYFFPESLAHLDLYAILVVYFAMGGQLGRVIAAGVITGFVQDVFSGSIFGLHAFSLTLTGYLVAYVNTKIVLKGPLTFGACLAAAILVNEVLILTLARLLQNQAASFVDAGIPYTMIITGICGVILFQMAESFSARGDVRQ